MSKFKWPAAHAHSLDELNAGYLIPGETCADCRKSTEPQKFTVTGINQKTKTITVSQTQSLRKIKH